MSDENGTPTMDDFFNEAVNQAEVEETLQRGLLPNGTYTTNPDEFGPMTVTPLNVEEKDDRGTVTGTRRVIVLSGRGRAKVKIKDPKTGQVNLESAEGQIRARLSPDSRNKRDWTTKEELNAPDSATALYAQAVKAYQQTFGERPKNVGQVLEYLRDHPAKFRVIQIGVPTERNPQPDGEPRNHVMGIYAQGRG